MIRFLLSFAALALLATPAAGQNFSDEAQLRKVETIRVVIIDNVRDGCLPKPDALRIEAELILRGAGIKVVDSNDEFPHQLWIAMVGEEVKQRVERGAIPLGACAAAVASNLLRDEYMKDGSVGRVQAFMTGGYTFVLKDQFQRRLQTMIKEYVSGLAREILKAHKKKPPAGR